MNKLIPGIICLALATGMNAAHADKAAPKKGKPAAYAFLVNGEPVLQVSLDYLAKKRTMGDLEPAMMAQRARKELETQTLMAQEVVKAGLDKNPEVVAQLDLARLALMSKIYLTDYFKAHPVTDADLKADYEKRKAAGEILEYHLRNILLKTEKDAREIAQKLKEGGDFAALAKANSLDPGVDKTSGDIGWVRPDIFIDLAFGDAVKTLHKPGDYTPEPIATRFGWNLLKLEEGPRKVEKLPNYDELPKEITKILRENRMQRMLDELISQLRSKAKITG